MHQQKFTLKTSRVLLSMGPGAPPTLQQWAPAAGPQGLGVGLDLSPRGLQVALLLRPGAVDAGGPRVQSVHEVQQLHTATPTSTGSAVEDASGDIHTTKPAL